MTGLLDLIGIKQDDLLHQAIRDLGRDRIREIKEDETTYLTERRTIGDFIIKTTEIQVGRDSSFYTSIQGTNYRGDNENSIPYGRTFRTKENALKANRILAEYMKKMGE